MKMKLAHMLVEFFQHCEKGDKFRTPDGNELECPGDAIFAGIMVDGTRFAVSCVSYEGKDLKPYMFEAALRATLASLAKSVGAPQDANVLKMEEVADAPETVQ